MLKDAPRSVWRPMAQPKNSSGSI